MRLAAFTFVIGLTLILDHCSARDSGHPGARSFKRMSPAGGAAVLRMAEESENIIYEYTDAQAIDDGVLAEVSCGAVNRVTSAVFYHFARPIENLPEGEVRFDITPLTATIRVVLGVTPDEDGWRKSTYGGKELWLVPNEVRGLTLMFPDDY